MLPKLILASTIIFILSTTLYFSPKHQSLERKADLIVFFGNSITAGQGAGPGDDFPSIIGKTLNVPIVNAGIEGNATHDALLRINKDVLNKKPSVVVIELGGNDLLQNIDTKEATKNLELILSKIKPTGAKIVILGSKFFLFQQKYEVNWEYLAKKYSATYVPDILEGVITDQNLKFDDIHPNAKGYQKIAEKLTPIIALTLQKRNTTLPK